MHKFTELIDLHRSQWAAARVRAEEIVRDRGWNEEDDDFFFQVEEEARRQWMEDLDHEIDQVFP